MVRKAELSFLCLLFVASSGVAQDVQRSIVHVSGDLYRAQNDIHYSAFLVTPEGIIVADPINRAFSEWLKAELAERFDQPVRYVIYSHAHWDHASGGEVFADTATFVGHEAALATLALPPAVTALPPDFQAMDADKDGRVSRLEATGVTSDLFALYDADANGVLTGPEATRGPVSDIYPPQVRFDGAGGSVTLGGKTVELIHIGPVHAADMSVLRFRDERAVFLVDFISVRRLPFQTMGDIDVDAITAAVRMVEQMEFDIAVGGHGDVGTREHVSGYARYLNELRDQVASGIEQGSTLEELQRTITMEDFRDWLNYDDWLALNIEGMYRILTTGQ